MKIIHIIEAMNDFGGTPRKLLYFSKYLNTNEHRCIFVVYLDSNLSSELENNDCEVINLKTTNPIRLLYNIDKIVRKEKPDVILTHYTRPFLIGGIISSLRNIPIIHNEHSSTHYKNKAAIFVSRLFYRKSKLIICNSQHTASSIENKFGNNLKYKIRVVYNPVNKRVISCEADIFRDKLSIKKDTLVITHVGGLLPERDQKTLIKAFFLIQKQFPNSVLLIVGKGPCEEELKLLANSNHVNSNIIFFGYSNEIGNILEISNIYVNPTLDEGFGIAVVEAMLQKIPVVLSNAGAHPELIRDKLEGLLYKGGDERSLFNSVAELINNRELYNTIKLNAYNKAINDYSPKIYVKTYLAAIEDVL